MIYLCVAGKRLVNCLRVKLSASSLLSKKEVRTDSSVSILKVFQVEKTRFLLMIIAKFLFLVLIKDGLYFWPCIKIKCM